jgi:hypothetical protein
MFTHVHLRERGHNPGVLDDAQTVGRLGATFQAAVEFGLGDKEIWATIVEVCCQDSHEDESGDPLEALSAALASKILEHERSAHAPD